MPPPSEEHFAAWRCALSLNNAAVSLTSRGFLDEAKSLFRKAVDIARSSCAHQIINSAKVFAEIQCAMKPTTKLLSNQRVPMLKEGINVVHSSTVCPVALSLCPLTALDDQFSFIVIDEIPFSESVDELQTQVGFILYNYGVAHLLAARVSVSRTPLSIPLHLLKAAHAILSQRAQLSIQDRIPELFSCFSMLAVKNLAILHQYLDLHEEASEAREYVALMRDHFLRASQLPSHSFVLAPAA